MQEETYALGMIGLGTMGRNLLLNMAEHGISVAGYDKAQNQVALLETEAKDFPVHAFNSLPEFIAALQSPKTIMLLVPAGKIVDSVIEDLIPLLQEGDIIIDGGNSHFTDTEKRVSYLHSKKLHFFGMGVSGGEEGARKGPSMMPGGDKMAYGHVQKIFEAIAAEVNGEPCVTYIGPGASGHFVKMVHNGIEYGLMQLLSETYEILKKGLKLDNEAIQKVYAQWNEGRSQSFLVEITKDIFGFKNQGSDHLLLDEIKDEARAKGTGKWTSQVAMDLELPVTIIDTAVSMRDLSKYKSLRVNIAPAFEVAGESLLPEEAASLLTALEEAFYFSTIITYAQGMHLLSKASVDYKYELDLAAIARIWRGGCIIRSAFLNDIFTAYDSNKQLLHLLQDSHIQELVNSVSAGTRTLVAYCIKTGLAVPAFASALSYFDIIRTANMPSNLIQAQRDYFGAHTYELVNQPGFFHTNWTGIPLSVGSDPHAQK